MKFVLELDRLHDFQIIKSLLVLPANFMSQRFKNGSCYIQKANSVAHMCWRITKQSINYCVLIEHRNCKFTSW